MGDRQMSSQLSNSIVESDTSAMAFSCSPETSHHNPNYSHSKTKESILVKSMFKESEERNCETLRASLSNNEYHYCSTPNNQRQSLEFELSDIIFPENGSDTSSFLDAKPISRFVFTEEFIQYTTDEIEADISQYQNTIEYKGNVNSINGPQINTKGAVEFNK